MLLLPVRYTLCSYGANIRPSLEGTHCSYTAHLKRSSSGRGASQSMGWLRALSLAAVTVISLPALLWCMSYGGVRGAPCRRPLARCCRLHR